MDTTTQLVNILMLCKPFSTLSSALILLSYLFRIRYLTSYALEELGPSLADQTLKVEVVAEGLNSPTSMTFLGPNNILFLEKNYETIKNIVKDTVLQQPVLYVEVAYDTERGMVGIADAKNNIANSSFMFLYYTESAQKDGDDI